EQPEMHGLGNFFEQARKVQIGRGVVRGVPAQDKERLYCAGLDCGGQVADRSGGFLAGIYPEDGRAIVTERLVDGEDKNLNPGGLLFADGHNAAARVRGKIIGAFREPGVVERSCRLWAPVYKGSQGSIPGCVCDFASELTGKFADQGCFAAIPVIREAAGARIMIFDNVEPVHWRALLIGIAARKEALRKADTLVASAQKLAIERNDDIGPSKFRYEPYSRSEGRRDSPLCFLCAEGFIFAPNHP